MLAQAENWPHLQRPLGVLANVATRVSYWMQLPTSIGLFHWNDCGFCVCSTGVTRK